MTDEVPPDKPETTPVVAPIVATLVFPLAHVPPPDASLKAVVAPAHSMVVPVIPEGKALTVTVAEVLQPVVVNVYKIVDVPADRPVTNPDDEPTMAAVVLLLLQVPPPVPSLSGVALPTHTLSAPVIATGKALTVIVLTAKHPVVSTYVMVAVPLLIPLIIPVVPPTETLVLLLVHVPPAMPSLRVVDDPLHTLGVPVMAVGLGLMVATVLVLQPVRGKVYTMVDVPGDTLVSSPEVKPMVATPVLLLVHVPPPASLKLAVVPMQILTEPTMIEGCELTVTVFVALQPVISE